MVILQRHNAFDIIERALDLVDPRLMHHGQRVAYIIGRILETGGQHTREEVQAMCVLGWLHDIGAYKTNEIDNMLGFDSGGVWEHSIYGSLFLQKMSPFHQMADAVLYHHLDYRHLAGSPCVHQKQAAAIKLADRIDLMVLAQGGNVTYSGIAAGRGTAFDPQLVDWFLRADQDGSVTRGLTQGGYRAFFQELVGGIQVEESGVRDLLRMISYSIDFRSEFTVQHTITTVTASMELARLAGLGPEERDQVYLGAQLHDMGKVAMPISILEKPGPLTAEEMAVMRSHVDKTAEILGEDVDPAIVNIAVRHHERLDGSGYPLGLTGDRLSCQERIVAIADMMSALIGRRSYKEPFPPEKVVGILREMADGGKICPELTRLAVEQYDAIVERIREDSAEILALYREIKREYFFYYNMTQSSYGN